ncbi:MAG TPA: hypothetical protein VH164_04810 [Ktedonobacteraceae bacterium]|jgi:hypothetical protein|nr:hypothetical protein [Ktedonobacteraceae bacterium]
MQMSREPDGSSSVSREQVTTAYLNALRFIDKRVTPFLGKATTRVLVQAAAKEIAPIYPFLAILEKMPYTEVVPAIIAEQCHVSVEDLNTGLNALLQQCFAGLKELTGDLIEPPLHEEVTRQLGEMP